MDRLKKNESKNQIFKSSSLFGIIYSKIKEKEFNVQTKIF